MSCGPSSALWTFESNLCCSVWNPKTALRRKEPTSESLLSGTAAIIQKKREKDIHITSLQMDLVNVTPVTPKDFAYIGGRTLLILPHGDKAFPPEMQEDLTHTMERARVEWIEGGTSGDADLCGGVRQTDQNILAGVGVGKSVRQEDFGFPSVFQLQTFLAHLLTLRSQKRCNFAICFSYYPH